MKLQIGKKGLIAIIGKRNEVVTIQVTGYHFNGNIVGLVNKFGKNCIQTSSIGEWDDVIFFEYNLRGGLRNPDRLLKKLRGKLIKAGHIVYTEFMRETSDLDQQIDHAFHHAPHECK